MSIIKYVFDPFARAFERWYDCSMSLIMDSILYAISFFFIFVGYYILKLFMAPLKAHNLLALDVLVQNVQLYETEATRFIYAFYILPVIVLLIISVLFGIFQCVITNYLGERELFENWYFLCLTNAVFFFILAIILFASIFVIKQSLVAYWLISLVIIFIFVSIYFLARYNSLYTMGLRSDLIFFKSVFEYSSFLQSLSLFIVSFILFMVIYICVTFVNFFISFELLQGLLLLYSCMVWIACVRLTILEAVRED